MGSEIRIQLKSERCSYSKLSLSSSLQLKIHGKLDVLSTYLAFLIHRCSPFVTELWKPTILKSEPSSQSGKIVFFLGISKSWLS